MKITDVRTVLLTGPCTNDRFLSVARRRRSAAFIEIYTDTELVGIGETYAGYFCPEMVPQLVEFYKPILIGQEPEQIEQLWERMYVCGKFWGRVGLGLSVLNGIEAALWDLKGKMYGLPVYELLGGLKHERLPCYATGGPANYPLSQLEKKLEYYLSLGFRGIKLGAGSYDEEKELWFMPDSLQAIVEFECAKMDFVRAYVPKGTQIMLDGHMDNDPANTWNLQTAMAVMKGLEPYGLLFFEEPLPYTDPWGYSELCKNTSIPIAGGECLTGLYEWQVFAERQSFDIGQPDASFTGGLSTFMQVAAMFEAQGKQIATHAWGAGGSLLQNIHCGFACANTIILEVPPDYAELHSEVIGDSLVMENGMILPPHKPGLGIELTAETKERFAFVPGSGEFNSVPGKILID